MKYYVRSDCMCSTNVAFNMKTVENVLIFYRISSFENIFGAYFLNFFSTFFLRYVIVCPVHANIAFAVLMAPRRD